MSLFWCVFGFFVLPLVAMKLNVDIQWILLYMAVVCAGMAAGD